MGQRPLGVAKFAPICLTSKEGRGSKNAYSTNFPHILIPVNQALNQMARNLDYRKAGPATKNSHLKTGLYVFKTM